MSYRRSPPLRPRGMIMRRKTTLRPITFLRDWENSSPLGALSFNVDSILNSSENRSSRSSPTAIAVASPLAKTLQQDAANFVQPSDEEEARRFVADTQQSTQGVGYEFDSDAQSEEIPETPPASLSLRKSRTRTTLSSQKRSKRGLSLSINKASTCDRSAKQLGKSGPSTSVRKSSKKVFRVSSVRSKIPVESAEDTECHSTQRRSPRLSSPDQSSGHRPLVRSESATVRRSCRHSSSGRGSAAPSSSSSQRSVSKLSSSRAKAHTRSSIKKLPPPEQVGAVQPSPSSSPNQIASFEPADISGIQLLTDNADLRPRDATKNYSAMEFVSSDKLTFDNGSSDDADDEGNDDNESQSPSPMPRHANIDENHQPDEALDNCPTDGDVQKMRQKRLRPSDSIHYTCAESGLALDNSSQQNRTTSRLVNLPSSQEEAGEHVPFDVGRGAAFQLTEQLPASPSCSNDSFQLVTEIEASPPPPRPKALRQKSPKQKENKKATEQPTSPTTSQVDDDSEGSDTESTGGCNVRLWQGGQKRKASDILDLDIILNCFEEMAWEERQRTESVPMKRIINEFARRTQHQLRETIIAAHCVKQVQKKLRKSDLALTRARKKLLQTQQQYFQLQREVLQLGGNIPDDWP